MKVLQNLAIFSFIVLVFPTTNTKAVTELQFKNGMFNVSWKHLPETEEIEFELHVKSAGYVALGLTKNNTKMKGLDIVFVAVSGNKETIKDMNANAEQSPSEDTTQDYTLISASESNGRTVARVKRKLVTSDAKNLQIQPGEKVYLAWATSQTSDTLTYHSNRGYSSMMHELVSTSVVNTTASSNNVTSTTATTEPSTTRQATPTTTGNMITGSSFLSILAIIFALMAY